MKKNIRSFISMICVIGFCLYMMPANASAQWVHSSNGYSYRDDGTGEKLTGWQAIQGETYYFDSNGIALTGWQVIGGDTYYFSSSNKGKMMTGKVKINGKTYEFGDDGVLIGSTSGTTKSASKKATTKTTTKTKNKNPSKFPDGLKYGMSLSSVKKQLKGYDYKIDYSDDRTMIMYQSGSDFHIIYITDDYGYCMHSLLKYCSDMTTSQLMLLGFAEAFSESDNGYTPCCSIYENLGLCYYNKRYLTYIMYGEFNGYYFVSVTEIPRNATKVKTAYDAEKLGESVYDAIYQ